MKLEVYELVLPESECANVSFGLFLSQAAADATRLTLPANLRAQTQVEVREVHQCVQPPHFWEASVDPLQPGLSHVEKLDEPAPARLRFLGDEQLSLRYLARHPGFCIRATGSSPSDAMENALRVREDALSRGLGKKLVQVEHFVRAAAELAKGEARQGVCDPMERWLAAEGHLDALIEEHETQSKTAV